MVGSNLFVSSREQTPADNGIHSTGPHIGPRTSVQSESDQQRGNTAAQDDTPLTQLLNTDTMRDYLRRPHDPPEHEPLGTERDPTLRTFGNLGEGLTYHQQHPASQAVMAQRYRLRRNLANLVNFPEGYEFPLHLLDGSRRNAFVLSPPELVAERLADGRWFRRERDEEMDGPEPYSFKWYYEYLARSGLPSWFLSEEHTRMLRNWEGARREAAILDESRESEQRPPALEYMVVRYPSSPAVPATDAVVDEDGEPEPYYYTMSPAERHRVSRNFPAVNAVPHDNDIKVIVWPTGHITLLHDEEAKGETPAIEKGAMAWTKQKGAKLTASYVSAPEHPARHTMSMEDINAAVEAATARGALVNPIGIPRGVGSFRWLSEEDRQRATTLGFDSAQAVTEARGAGLLAQGVNTIQPNVLFYSDERYLNPRRQPDEPGHWEYRTDDDREIAHLNLSGQEVYGLGNVPRPTAEQIWQLRRRLRRFRRQGHPVADITSYSDGNGVNLVWVSDQPAEPGPDTSSVRPGSGEVEARRAADPASDEEAVHEHDDAAPIRTGPGHSLGQTDPDSNLPHDPTNGGDHGPATYRDQTGADDQAHYRTRRFGSGAVGRTITIDRARATVNFHELHKTWLCDRNGVWQRYPHFLSLDWTSKASVKQLNKWREQQCSRWGWGQKRERHVDWTDEERRWFFETYIQPARGSSLGQKQLGEVVVAFNAKFGGRNGARNRNYGSITSQEARLRKMYVQFGEFTPGAKRGHNLARMHEARRQRRRMEAERGGGQGGERGDRQVEDDGDSEDEEREGESGGDGDQSG